MNQLVLTAVVLILVTVVATVVLAVAGPQPADALAVAADELVVVAREVSGDAHLALVHQLGGRVALALDLFHMQAKSARAQK